MSFHVEYRFEEELQHGGGGDCQHLYMTNLTKCSRLPFRVFRFLLLYHRTFRSPMLQQQRRLLNNDIQKNLSARCQILHKQSLFHYPKLINHRKYCTSCVQYWTYIAKQKGWERIIHKALLRPPHGNLIHLRTPHRNLI